MVSLSSTHTEKFQRLKLGRRFDPAPDAVSSEQALFGLRVMLVAFPDTDQGLSSSGKTITTQSAFFATV